MPQRSAPLLVVAFVSAVAAVTTTVVWQVVTDGSEDARGTATEPVVLPRSDADARIAALEAEVASLRNALDLARSAPRRDANGSSPRVGTAEFEAAVRDAVARALAANGDVVDASPDAEFDLASVLQELRGGQLTAEELEELWRWIRESGRVDEVIAALEELALANPNDSRAHTELASAYFNKMLTLSGPDGGQYGARGHASLLRALELDETNWDARFAAAQHEYWAGLGGDSLANFETLIAQQSDRVTEPKHAQAYLWLGNLYMDRDRRDDAIATWEKGLALFPGHGQLKARIDAFR